MLRAFSQRIANLMAEWVRVGFVQGNFNSDNCLVGGRTMDYGPFGFVQRFEVCLRGPTRRASNRIRVGHGRWRMGVVHPGKWFFRQADWFTVERVRARLTFDALGSPSAVMD